MSFPEGLKPRLIRSAYTVLNCRHYMWPAPYLSNAVAPAHITMTASHKTVVKRPFYQSLHRGRKAHGAEHAKRAASLASRWLKGTPAMENRNPSARKQERGRFPPFCLLLERSRRSLMHVVLHASFVVRHHLFRLRLLVRR